MEIIICIPRLDLSWGYRCYRDYIIYWFQVRLPSHPSTDVSCLYIFVSQVSGAVFLILPMPHVHHFGTQRSMIRFVIREDFI